jgi:putative Mn2+ efflux pump MntP
MQLWELFIIAVGLSADAFAVAVCKGLSVAKIKKKHGLTVGLYFGGFQGLMPLLGFLLAFNFASYIESFDHWIAFLLLAAIGINMIKESRECAEELDDSFSFKSMFPMAIATSIVAMAVGISYAAIKLTTVEVCQAASLIAIITFILSWIGLIIGNKFGCKFKSKAEITGGIILIGMGIKILVEHLFFA